MKVFLDSIRLSIVYNNESERDEAKKRLESCGFIATESTGSAGEYLGKPILHVYHAFLPQIDPKIVDLLCINGGAM